MSRPDAAALSSYFAGHVSTSSKVAAMAAMAAMTASWVFAGT